MDGFEDFDWSDCDGFDEDYEQDEEDKQDILYFRKIRYATRFGLLEELKQMMHSQTFSCPSFRWKWNFFTENGKTATMLAADFGQLDILRYLVEEKGAQCDDTVQVRGMTCTFLAARSGHLHILEYLIDEQFLEFQEFIRDDSWRTCTMHAAENGHLDVLKYLKYKGAKCNKSIRDSCGNTCALLAVTEGHLHVLKYLVDTKQTICDETNQYRRGNWTCAMIAASEGHLEVLRYLVDTGLAICDDSIRDDRGRTCAMIAAEGGYSKFFIKIANQQLVILRYLVEEQGAKCDETIRDNDGMSCAMIAANNNQLGILKYLLDEKGFRYDDCIRDNKGQTTYDYACLKLSTRIYMEGKIWNTLSNIRKQCQPYLDDDVVSVIKSFLFKSS